MHPKPRRLSDLARTWLGPTRTLCSWTAAVCILCLGSVAMAQSVKVPVQAHLTDTAGVPIQGATQITFELFTDAAMTSSLWTETQSVPVDAGLFTAYMGEVTPLDASVFAFNTDAHFTVTVGADSPMGPWRVGAVPISAYAHRSGDAGSLGGVAANGYVTTAQLSVYATDAQLDAFAMSPSGACSAGQLLAWDDVAGQLVCATPAGIGAGSIVPSMLSAADFAGWDQDEANDLLVSTSFSGDVSGLYNALSLANGAVTTPKIAAGAVTTGKIAAGAVVASKIGSGAVTQAKLGAGAVSAGISTYNNAASGLAGSTVQAALDELGTFHRGGYARNPLVLMGIDVAGCTGKNNNQYYGTVVFPSKFGTDPVVVLTGDETANNDGSSWWRLRRVARSRTTYRCNANSDMMHWMAMEAGVHTISGKKVMAGKVGSSTGNGDAVFFPATFDVPPVVLIFGDETGDNSGGSRQRVINTPTTQGFEIWADGTFDDLHFIAMEPGEYEHGRYTWTAGTFDTVGCAATCTRPWPGAGFDSAPGVLMTINEVNNSGATWVRLHTVKRDEITFRSDSAAMEVLNWVAFEDNY